MCDDGRDVYQSKFSKANTSKHLLYSEYTDNSVAEHIVESLENKKKTKPIMLHKKNEGTSLIQKKCNKLLELFAKRENELNEKSSEELDIQVLSDEAYINMDVFIPVEANDSVEGSRELEFSGTSPESSTVSDSGDESESFEVDDKCISSRSERNSDEKTHCTIIGNKGTLFEISDDETDDDLTGDKFDSSSGESQFEFSEAEDNISISSQDYSRNYKEAESTAKGNKRPLITEILDGDSNSIESESQSEFSEANTNISIFSQNHNNSCEGKISVIKGNKRRIIGVVKENFISRESDSKSEFSVPDNNKPISSQNHFNSYNETISNRKENKRRITEVIEDECESGKDFKSVSSQDDRNSYYESTCTGKDK